MPGETITDAVRAVRELQSEGTPSIVTFLGENVASDQEADETVAEYGRLIQALARVQAHTHVSIKLTQFGWDLERGRAFERVRSVAQVAADANLVLAIDMESYEYVDSTVLTYEMLKREFTDVALCLQAYLHRTPSDIERLLPVQPHIRLVKGAYRESPAVAIQRRDEVSARYRVLARDLLSRTGEGVRVALGTHDMELLQAVRSDAGAAARNSYEVQMLYGIQTSARRSLAASGERVRVLISYGRAWYPWFMRRLAENPANLLLVARNLAR